MKKNAVGNPLLQTDGKYFWEMQNGVVEQHRVLEFHGHCYVLCWQLHFMVIAYKICQKLKSCWNETGAWFARDLKLPINVNFYKQFWQVLATLSLAISSKHWYFKAAVGGEPSNSKNSWKKCSLCVCAHKNVHVRVQAIRAPYSMSMLRRGLASAPIGFGRDLSHLCHSLVNVVINSSWSWHTWQSTAQNCIPTAGTVDVKPLAQGQV